VVDTHLDLTGTWEHFPEAERNLQSRGERSFNTGGGEAGGLIGYNYQFGGNWVIGAEAAGGYLWERNSNSVEFGDSELERDVKISGFFKTHYLWWQTRLCLMQLAALRDRWSCSWRHRL
jgi:hypothetical protein